MRPTVFIAGNNYTGDKVIAGVIVTGEKLYATCTLYTLKCNGSRRKIIRFGWRYAALFKFIFLFLYTHARTCIQTSPIVVFWGVA